ncbi:MAG: amino acid permease, partial [Planctomycetales bacterium]|nr:amino acid permease [Planctomycetales bacterium]NIP71476.1 amino acid permease [Planctomycetales bacterium]
MGGEIRNGARNVPRAIVVGVLIVTVVYLLANWAYFRLLGFEGVANSRALAADAISRVWPEIGQRFVAGAVAFSAFGVLNAQLLSGPRL